MMDKTKSKLTAFFGDDEEDSSFPQKPVDEAKLSQYTSGTVRKSRREKEQEAAEHKKREEETQAAKAYAEFLDAFQGEEVGRKRKAAFVKAGSDGTEYAPTVEPTGPSKVGTERFVASMERSISPPHSAPKPKGKRAMDAFLEEIKREQAEREAKYSRKSQHHGRSITALAAYEGQSGSKDRGDPQTSNVFVANLPPHVTEESLGHFFAKAGPVGSVKIMWPRTDGTAGPGADMTATRRSKAGLSGFVSFMKRRDAEEALREFDGYDWGGSVLRVGWSKAVPIAAKPKYVASSYYRDRPRSRSRSRSHERRRSRSRSRDTRDKHHYSSRRSRSRSRSYDRSRSRSRSRRRSHSRSRRHQSPRNHSPRRRYSLSPLSRAHTEEEEAVTDTFIRAVAAEVKGQDATYEVALREREQSNPKYAFLLHKNHRRHAFYRGLIESERPLKPEFDDDGYNSVYSTDSGEESERERTRKNKLGKLARKRFEAMIRSMIGKRGEIARCMTFCLEHAEAAHEVADIIVASLLVDGTAVPRKVARLHLICDILHNSAAPVPSAWKFRQEFQSRLGIVFDHLANIYHSFPGRMTAEVFKKQILAVVEIWEDWIVFPPEFTHDLRQRLEGAAIPTKPQVEGKVDTGPDQQAVFSSKFKSSTFKATMDPVIIPTHPRDGSMEISDVDGEPVDDIDGEPVDDVDGVPVDDIDGEVVDEDVDGEPVDIDGVPVDDVDGMPVDDDDVDGIPVDEELDGMPVDIDGIPVDDDRIDSN